MTTEEKQEIVQHHLDALMEHFDCVQILCSTHDPQSGATDYCSRGSGNLFARLGHLRLFLVKEEKRFSEDV